MRGVRAQTPALKPAQSGPRDGRDPCRRRPVEEGLERPRLRE